MPQTLVEKVTGRSGFEKAMENSGLFGHDTLMPNEYLDTFRRTSHLEPEKRLMNAVLEDAVYCYQKYIGARDKTGKGLFQEAEDWIFGNDELDTFSYNHVCESLGLSPSYLRNGILRWKEDALSGKQKPPENKYDRSNLAKK